MCAERVQDLVLTLFKEALAIKQRCGEITSLFFETLGTRQRMAIGT